MSRKLDINLNQLFDLIIHTYDSTTCFKVAALVGTYSDTEIYEYVNSCANEDGGLPVEEAARRLTMLDEFRKDYCKESK